MKFVSHSRCNDNDDDEDDDMMMIKQILCHICKSHDCQALMIVMMMRETQCGIRKNHSRCDDDNDGDSVGISKNHFSYNDDNDYD